MGATSPDGSAYGALRTWRPAGRPAGWGGGVGCGAWRWRYAGARRASSSRALGALLLEAVALFVGHLANHEGALIDLLLHPLELELTLLGLSLALRLRGHACVLPGGRGGHTGGRCIGTAPGAVAGRA